MARFLLWGGCFYASVLALLALLPLAPWIWCLGFFFLCVWSLGFCSRHFNWSIGFPRLRETLESLQSFSLGAFVGIACALIGAYLAGALFIPEPQLDQSADNWVDVKVQSDPQVSDQTLIFQGQVVSPFSEFADQPFKIYWSMDRVELESSALSEPPKLGSVWRLPFTFKKPRGLANPGVLSTTSQALAQGVKAIAIVQSEACALKCVEVTPPKGMDLFRSDLTDQFKTYFKPGPGRAFALALVLGNQSELGPYRPLINRHGLSHLFAVSGMHISMMALLGMGFGLLVWHYLAVPLWYFFHWPLHHLPQALTLALFFGWGIAFGYGALTGFALPAQRAVIAFSVCALGRYWFGQNLWLQSFAVSLVLILIMAPYAPLGLSFWFSFMAIALLLLAFDQVKSPRRDQRFAWIQPLLFAQCLMSFGLLPLSLLMGDDVQLFTPLVNLIAIPLVQICFLPLLMLVTLAFALIDLIPQAVLLGLVALVQDAFELAYLLLEKIPLMGLGGGVALSFTQSLIFMLVVVLVMMPSFKQLKWGFVPGLLLLSCMNWKLLPAGDFSVKQFDLGQGSGVLIETRNHRLLYDLGPMAYRGASATEKVILPYFRFYGVRHLDQLIVSHQDQASTGNEDALHAMLRIDQVLKSTEGVRLDPLAATCYGRQWVYDGVTFEILEALPKRFIDLDAPFLSTNQISNHRNNQSCILKVSTDDSSALIFGDLENNAIEYLLQEARRDSKLHGFLQADLMVVPFHGSLKSSSTGLLHAVQPKIAFVSAGYEHPFGHPHSDIINRFHQRDIPLMNTADQGFLEWNTINKTAQGYRVIRNQQGLW